MQTPAASSVLLTAVYTQEQGPMLCMPEDNLHLRWARP